MSSIGLSLVFQKSPVWRIQMVASFLMRICCGFFKFSNDDSQKLKLCLVGTYQFCYETHFGEGFSGPERKFGSEMSDTSAEPAMSWVQQSIMTTETLMPFLGLTAKSWPPASWATADFSSAGWKKDDFSLSCSYIKDFENNWLYPDTEQKKLWKCLWEKDRFLLRCPRGWISFPKYMKTFFFFLICASAQFTNKRSITLCTKHGSGKKQNQLQSFPLSCHRLLVIADSLRNIFTSIYTTYKWAALPAVHSHCCVPSGCAQVCQCL